MTTVELHGKLAKKFGRMHRFSNISKPYQVIRAISANTQGFKSFINRCAQNNENFEVLINNDSVSSKELHKEIKIKKIDIVPVLGGHMEQFLLLFAKEAFNYALNSGGGYNFQGVIDIMPDHEYEQGKMNPLAKTFAYSNRYNITAQGEPVPIGYGLLRIGSKVVSLDSNQYDANFFQSSIISANFDAAQDERSQRALDRFLIGGIDGGGY